MPPVQVPLVCIKLLNYPILLKLAKHKGLCPTLPYPYLIGEIQHPQQHGHGVYLPLTEDTTNNPKGPPEKYTKLDFSAIWMSDQKFQHLN